MSCLLACKRINKHGVHNISNRISKLLEVGVEVRVGVVLLHTDTEVQLK